MHWNRTNFSLAGSHEKFGGSGIRTQDLSVISHKLSMNHLTTTMLQNISIKMMYSFILNALALSRVHPTTCDTVGNANFIRVTIPVNQPRTVLDEIEVINFDSNCVFIGNRRYTFPVSKCIIGKNSCLKWSSRAWEAKVYLCKECQLATQAEWVWSQRSPNVPF